MGYVLAGIALLVTAGAVWYLHSRRANRDPRGGPGRYSRDDDSRRRRE